MAWTETINFTNNTMNTRSRDAFATAYGYQDTIGGAPNPETKAQFRARMVKDYMKAVTFAEEKKAASAAIVDPTVQD